ncbi:MAG: sulfatase-like hydrolase/transferase [Pseudomonadota bacterium]
MSDRPNVLLVAVDQWPGRLLGVAGHPVIQTPTLDQLARNGVRFERAYSECPICIPARRTLMTGATPRHHGDRVFRPAGRMPDLPTLPQTFREAGYQAFAVGKLHVYPPRDRIGFDEVWLAEEGRPHLGTVDDHDLYLADRGHVGRQFLHGMSNNDYLHRPWHLPEDCHVTNWITWQTCRTIKRRDPTRPAFWHVSYTHPHPPLVPLPSYMDAYRRFEPPAAATGAWSADVANLPAALQQVRAFWQPLAGEVLAEVRRAFYALCTHIDHQLRVVLGTLREEGVLDDTHVLVVGDHGDMLGDHGLWAKRTFYEGAANVPCILQGRGGDPRVTAGRTDARLVGLQDVMPTLLDLAGLRIPQSCDGLSMIGDGRRASLYGDCLESVGASRMIHDGRHKLIWYPAGNLLQLFDVEADPAEGDDLATHPDHVVTRERLTEALAGELWGHDRAAGWVRDGRLVGFAPPSPLPHTDLGLKGQRGLHYPEPPAVDPETTVGTPG